MSKPPRPYPVRPQPGPPHEEPPRPPMLEQSQMLTQQEWDGLAQHHKKWVREIEYWLPDVDVDAMRSLIARWKQTEGL